MKNCRPLHHVTAMLLPIPSSPASARRRATAGFSLMELVAVMAIMAVLATITIPVVVPMMRSSSLNSGAAMLVDEFNLARQTAMTENRDVEVRIYRTGSASNPADLQYRGFRSLIKESDEPLQWKALTRVRYLPDPVIFSADPNFSTLLDAGNASRSGLTSSSETLPNAATPTPYISFLFRPTGGTNLSPVDPPVGNWFLTLHSSADPLNATTGLPNNYFTCQVEPVTGRIRTYRP
ncbi:hypothetical protein DB346_20495 [Verrucomicrobia bacterium LW23]|nr:hypothetical protein DB346_20495 [Verrucomicrobia bacterium LW23]